MSEDRELLTLFIKDGSRSALSEVIERYRRMVYAICLRELSDPDDAADATQATFLLLQKSASRIKRRERLSSWLYTAARHVCRNARRERDRRHRIEGVPLMDSLDIAFPAPQPDGDPDVMRHFDRLPENDRLALSLRYLNGMSVKEVGASLGIAEHSAQMRLARALERFRNLLQKSGMTMAMVDLDRIMSNQLPWNAPVVNLEPKADHRWATRMQPSPAKVLLRVGAVGFGSLAGMVLFLPVVALMAYGQVPSNLAGAWQTWHMMGHALTGQDRTVVSVGTWVTDEDPTAKNWAELSVLRSPDGEHFAISMAIRPQAGQPAHDMNMLMLEHFGKEWRMNGNPATSVGGDKFQWDRGDWTLAYTTDRSAERLSFHAEGGKLSITHERGGSMRSLKVDEQYTLKRAEGSLASYTTP